MAETSATEKRRPSKLKHKNCATEDCKFVPDGAFPGKTSLHLKNDKFGMNNFEWIAEMEECPVYRPTIEEFEDPLVYLRQIAPLASKYGICKIIPPLSASIPPGLVLMNEKKGFKFTTNVQPLRLSAWNNDDKIAFLVKGRNYTIREFENMANKAAARRYQVSGCLPATYLEREFWNYMIHGNKGSVEYAINVNGSAFSSSHHDPLSRSKWNLNTLPHLPTCPLRLLETEIPGVSEPMLYIGMLFSMFAWHVEDHYLYSINYHHCGAPKTWYGVPGNQAYMFEEVVQQCIYDEEILPTDGEYAAFNVLSQKTTIFPPTILLDHNIAVYKAVQLPGEFLITFPRAYHAGFSHGFNCGEAVNFSIEDWFLLGAEAIERYALLRRMPIIPHYELLCKEAMILSKSSSHVVNAPADFISVRCVKISFSCLLRLHHFICWCLRKLKGSLSIHRKDQGMIFCVLCKRECYLAHIMCKCHGNARCLFHEHEVSDRCKCGVSWKLYLREDIQEMQAVAKAFEKEEEISREVEQQMKHEYYLRLQSLIPCLKDEYTPYCEAQPDRNQYAVLHKSRMRHKSIK